MAAKISTLSDRVYKRIKEDILSNRLSPGEPLTEEKLCETFRISRTPVRDALKRLSHEGLLRIVPNKGFFVRVLSAEDIKEIFEVRETLEAFAVGRAAKRLSSEEVAKLLGLVKDLRRRRKELSYRDLRNAWHVLRTLAIRAVENGRIKTILDNLNEQIEVARHYSSAPPGRIEDLLRDFVAVVAALKKRNEQKAEEAMRSHLTKSKHVLLALFAGEEGKSVSRRHTYG